MVSRSISHSRQAMGAWFVPFAGFWAISGAGLLAAAPGGAAEIVIPASVRTAGQRVPKYDNGRLIVFHRAGLAGEPLQLEILAPGAGQVTWKAQDSLGRYQSVSDVAVDRDGGGVAATGAWAGSEDREFRLYLFDPQGRVIRSFSTNPYACNLVTLDSTGAIVCFGAMGNRDDNPRGGNGVFRRYSREGHLLWESVPRSSFSGTGHPSAQSGNVFSFLTATAQGIAAYNAPTQEWIELANDGALLSRVRLEVATTARVDTFARLEDGAVYFQDGDRRLYRWVPKSGPPVAVPSGNYQLWGAFGSQLAVEDWVGGSGRVRLIAPPSQ